MGVLSACSVWGLAALLFPLFAISSWHVCMLLLVIVAKWVLLKEGVIVAKSVLHKKRVRGLVVYSDPRVGACMQWHVDQRRSVSDIYIHP